MVSHRLVMVDGPHGLIVARWMSARSSSTIGSCGSRPWWPASLMPVPRIATCSRLSLVLSYHLSSASVIGRGITNCDADTTNPRGRPFSPSHDEMSCPPWIDHGTDLEAMQREVWTRDSNTRSSIACARSVSRGRR